ncbi:hypothetical protein V1512DRAFT_75303 [Lipomyces arxii]|uniref:uncharacterized protein n=1 Tax=Lipomyces arxii TaxID=56418 RepID=UPI0034CF8804
MSSSPNSQQSEYNAATTTTAPTSTETMKNSTQPDREAEQSKPVIYQKPTLYEPRAVPVWAARNIAQQEHSQATSKGPPTTSSNKSTSSAASQPQMSTLTHKSQQAPPSPLLAATKTTMPVCLSLEQSPSTHWNEFVSLSQHPAQANTESELRQFSSQVKGTGATARIRQVHGSSGSLSSEPRTGEPDSKLLIHPKRVVISNADLEQQMDLSGPWIIARDHNVGKIGHELLFAVNKAVPLPAALARRGRRNSASESFSQFSTSSMLSQFRMTAELTEKQRQERWKLNLRVTLLDSPYVPMTLRSGIFALSVLALALAANIFSHSNHFIPQQPSTIMAICVQSIAMVYLVYITYDEYSGKPLGLRQAKDKVKLVMLDLLFIIFSSANLALTFNTLFDDSWVCQDSEAGHASLPFDGPICRRQRSLASFLFLILLMWVMTFSVSIFRVVERVSGGAAVR